MPKNAEVRITTTVVAYTSRRDGQVTRFISFLTSVRNERLVVSQPSPRRSPPLPLSRGCSIATELIVRSLLPASCLHRDGPLPLRRSYGGQPSLPLTGSPIHLRATRYGGQAALACQP